MRNPKSYWGVLLAAVSGFGCVAIGAFGAHGVADERARALIETGVRFQSLHTMATLACYSVWNWGAPKALRAAPFFLAGIALFSGSLYALALGAPRWAGMVTPLGGLAFLAGWLLLAWASWEMVRPSDA